MKLSNGHKTIERDRSVYENNITNWTLRGWSPVEDKPIKPKEVEIKEKPIKVKKDVKNDK